MCVFFFFGGGAGYRPSQVLIPPQMLTKEMLSYRSQRLTLATMNVTRDKLSNKTRFTHIIDALETIRADFVFLQEVTLTFLQRLEERPWVRQSYYLSDAQGTTFGDRKCGQVRRADRGGTCAPCAAPECSLTVSETGARCGGGWIARQIIMSRLPFVELRATELRSRNGNQGIIGVVVVNNRRVGLGSIDLDDHPDDDTLR